MTAFSDTAPCIVEVTNLSKAVHTSETLAYSSETTWCYILEGSHLHT
jgi:hypothetical protein